MKKKKSDKEEKVHFSFRVERSLIEEVERKAAEEEHTISSLLRLLMKRYLREREKGK